MLRYKTDLLRHIFSLKTWMEKNGAVGNIDMGTLAARIQYRERTIHLHPQVVTKSDDGGLGYTAQLGKTTVGFVGWLPYTLKRWPHAQDKYAFKQFVGQNGLRTPRHTTDRAHIAYPFIIKAARSSFGYGIRGPYSPPEAHLPEATLQPGEYYEEIIFGKIARAWYWNATLAAIEIFDMPKITGDGRLSLKEAVRNAIGAEAVMPTALDRIAAVQGVAADAPLSVGTEVVADYRYVSALNPTVNKNFNILDAIRGSDIHAQFELAGKAVYRGIPEELRPNTASVVDAIVDHDENMWLLEVNCNAQLHPDIYGTMLDGITAESAPLPSPSASIKGTKSMTAPTYRIDVATKEDALKISELRRSALTASKQFSLRDLAAANWSEIDETSIVLAVRSGGDIVASMRMTIFNDVEAAQEFLQYPVARESIAGPVLAMSRAVTLPALFNSGLNSAVRYAYLTMLSKSAGSRIANVIAIVYQGAPRVNSMQKAGFTMVECADHWDGEAHVNTQPLIAVLPKDAFAKAMQHTAAQCAGTLAQCTFDWPGIFMRFEQVYVTAL